MGSIGGGSEEELYTHTHTHTQLLSFFANTIFTEGTFTNICPALKKLNFQTDPNYS